MSTETPQTESPAPVAPLEQAPALALSPVPSAAPPSTPQAHRPRWLKPALWCAWLLLPIAGLAYHVTAGEPHLQRDAAGELVRQAELILKRDTTTDPLTGEALDKKARQEAGKKKHLDAAGKFAAARAALPDGDTSQRLDLRLLETQHRIEAGELIEAQATLQGLLGEYESTGRNAPRINDIRQDLGRASYFLAYAMRVQGAPQDEWWPETDTARQQFRHLAEVVGGEKLEDYKRDLETVIRFQRLPSEPDEDEGPGPSKNAGKPGKKRSQKYSKGKSQGDADAREKIKSDAASSAQRGKGS